MSKPRDPSVNVSDDPAEKVMVPMRPPAGAEASAPAPEPKIDFETPPKMTGTAKDAAAAALGFAPLSGVDESRSSLRREHIETEPLRDVASEQTLPNTPVEIPRNMLDGHTTKMDVAFRDPDFLDKWHPHWFNDEGTRMHMAGMSGYVFVDADEITGNLNDPTPSNQNTGTRVSRYVGTNSKGQAMEAYLMKKPMHIHLAHRASYDARVDSIASVLRSGEANRLPDDGRYTAETVRGQSALPEIKTSQATMSRPRQPT